MGTKRLCLIAPKYLEQREFFGYHRDVILDLVFAGGVALKETFKLLNDPNLTKEKAIDFYYTYLDSANKIPKTSRGTPFFSCTDFYKLNRYITQYIGSPLVYDEKYVNPVNNRVAEYITDYLVEAGGWAKVQDKIYTADPSAYTELFAYASKGYYIDLAPYELHYMPESDKFLSVSNRLRERLYAEDKEIYDHEAEKLAVYRTRYFREQIIGEENEREFEDGDDARYLRWKMSARTSEEQEKQKSKQTENSPEQ